MLTRPRTELTGHLDAAAFAGMAGAAGPVLAAGPVADYQVDATGDAGSRTGARLSQVAQIAEARDRQAAELVGQLVAVLDADDLAEVTGGMSLHVWLQHQARCTHGEARDLLAVAEAVRHLPATCEGLGDGWLSFSQVQAIARAARRIPVRQRSDLDRLVSEAMVAHRDWQPDALVSDVWDWVDRHQPSRLEQAESAAERDRFLTLSPRLFGGGSLYGEFGPVGFATIAEALDAPLGPPVAVPDGLDDAEQVEEAFDTLDEQRRALTRGHGRALADRLVGLCERELAGTAEADGRDGARQARPLVIATVDLEALLDQRRSPGWLLHTLAGGRMKVTSSALQRLVDERGADLRTVVLDDCGDAIGVGWHSYVPPWWLRETAWAVNVATRDPDGATPIRRADLDHVVPWPHGPTDASNLAPLGRPWHNRKTSKPWTVDRARDGTLTWRHRRHGWQIRLAPPRRDLTDVPDPGPPRLPLDHLDDVPEPA